MKIAIGQINPSVGNFKNNKEKYPAYGEGHTVYYKLEEELQQNIKTLKNNEIEARIHDKNFDLIIYLNPDTNCPYKMD